jgi:hypothetical protein
MEINSFREDAEIEGALAAAIEIQCQGLSIVV